MSMWVGNNLGM